MKRVLFISQSRLSHNLMRALLPLIPKQIDLTCSTNLEEILSQAKRGTPYRVLIFDWNVFAEGDSAFKQLGLFKDHRLLKEGAYILIHPRTAKVNQQKFNESGIREFHTKPFLLEEVAKIIEKNL